MLKWEELQLGGVSNISVHRAKVPGGWLIMTRMIVGGAVVAGGIGITFYPDPLYIWNGSSLP
jgi:hypothetical protein